MSSWTLYWITRMDLLQSGFITGFIIFGISTLLLLFARFATEMEEAPIPKKFYRWAWLCIFGTIISGLGWVVTPTTKEMAAILVIPAVANSETVREFPGTVKDLADAWMKKQLEELKDAPRGNSGNTDGAP